MTRLYELADQYNLLLDLIEQGEEGFDEALAELRGNVESKVEGVAMAIRSLEVDAEAYESEIKRLNARVQAKSNAVKRLKEYLKAQMEVTSIEHIKGKVVDVRLQNSAPSVNVSDLEQIPSEFLSTRVKLPWLEVQRLGKADGIEPDVDKRGILAQWKETGEEVEGTEIVRGKHVVLR